MEAGTGEEAFSQLREELLDYGVADAPTRIELAAALNRLGADGPPAAAEVAAAVERITGDDQQLLLSLLRHVADYQAAAPEAGKGRKRRSRKRARRIRWAVGTMLAFIIVIAVGVVILNRHDAPAERGPASASGPTPSPNPVVVALSGTFQGTTATCPGVGTPKPQNLCVIPVHLTGADFHATVGWDTHDPLTVVLAGATGQDVVPQSTERGTATISAAHPPAGDYRLRVINGTNATGPIHFTVSYQS
jgi:hypothetical protein